MSCNLKPSSCQNLTWFRRSSADLNILLQSPTLQRKGRRMRFLRWVLMLALSTVSYSHTPHESFSEVALQCFLSLVSCLTWNRYLMQCWHFIILWFFWWLSKILLFLVEKLPSVTSWFITFTRTSWTLAYSITRAGNGRGNWMTIHVRAGQDICWDVNSLL